MTDTQITVPEIVVRVPAHTVNGIIAAAPAVSAATAVTTPEEDREKDAASDRNDFIKRLFAVAISVGFANHIESAQLDGDVVVARSEDGATFSPASRSGAYYCP
jgi:hypothetical protein